MPRRTPSLIEALLFKPWWVSAVTGVVLFLFSSLFISSVTGRGDAFAQGFGKAAGIIPIGILVLFTFLSIGAAVMGFRRKALISGQTSVETIRGLSWPAFESLVAEAYRRQGYEVEQTLRGGSDGGVDLVLRKNGQTTLVQCKQWRSSAVGAPVVREIFGVQIHEHAHRSIVITSGHFTREAHDFAAGKPMQLVDGSELLRMVRDVQTPPSETPANVPLSSDTVLCPTCGSPMVLRTARRGKNAGGSFWGCSKYPRCTGTRAA